MQLLQFEIDSLNIIIFQNVYKIFFKQGYYIYDKIFFFVKVVLIIFQFKFRYKIILIRINEICLNFQYFDIDF